MKIAAAMLAFVACASLHPVASLAADVGPTVVSEPSTNERLSRARDAIKARDWQKSLTELTAALKGAPRNADVHNLLAYSYRKQAAPDLPKAFEHYKIALGINPKHRGAHEYIGEAYLMDKKPVEAERHLVELEKICGNRTCEEYADLSKALADYKAKNPTP